MAGRKEIPRELSIYINDRQVINSLGGVTREIGKVNAEMRNLNKNSATYDEDLKRLQKDLAQLRDRQSEFKEEIQSTTEVSNEAAEAVSKIFLGLTSGNLSMAKEGLEGIRGSVSGLAKSAMAFVATPIGAAIAVLSGIAIATKAIFDFNVQAEKGARLIEDLSGKTGQVVEDIRVKIQALTDTFGVGFDQLAAAVDNLVDTGAVKDEFEALELIKNGLLTAPDKNEFVSSLESSAVAAKQIGADLETVIALKKQIEETGVDPEATFGALQKASLNLEKQTDKTRKALTDAFGAAFTDEVLAKVKTGELTTIQALDLIGKKSKELGLNQTQQAQLTTELFGKAGLAAGGYATILETVNKAQESQTKELNANQSALQTLADANERLGKAQSELFRIEGFGSMWDIIKAKATDALSSILEWVIDIKDDIKPLTDLIGIVLVVAWENLKNSVAIFFDFVGGAFRAISNTIKTFVDFFKAIVKGDFGGAFEALKNGFFNLGAIVKNTFGGIYNIIIGSLQGIVRAVAPILEGLGIDVDKLQKKLESFKVKEVKLKTSTGDTVEEEKKTTKATQEELAKQQAIRDEARKKEEEARQKALAKKKADEERAAKEALDRQVALANALANLAKAELNYYISTNRSKLENGQKLSQELIDQEVKRLDDIRIRQIKEADDDRNAKVKKAEREGKSAEEINALKEAYYIEYLTKENELTVAFETQKQALKRQLEEQEKQLRMEQLAYDNELALLEAETKSEEERLSREQKYNAEIADLEKARDAQKITEDEFTRFKTALIAKEKEAKRLAQIQDAEDTLNDLGKIADATVAIFGQNKAAASATALINGGLAVTEILKQPSTLPSPFNYIQKGIEITAAAISTAKAISQINSAKPPKRAKFFFGGNTGNKASLGYDEYGAVTGVVHKGEWVAPEVMTQSPRYAPILSYLENERQKIYGNKFADGGAASGSTPSTPALPGTDTALLDAINRLNNHLDSGIIAKTFIGYEQAEDIKTLTEETSQSNQNGTLNS